MSIQPGNKAVEDLINSTPVLGREKKRKREKKTVNAFLIKNSKGERGRGGKGGLSQTVGMTGRSSMGV